MPLNISLWHEFLSKLRLIRDQLLPTIIICISISLPVTYYFSFTEDQKNTYINYIKASFVSHYSKMKLYKMFRKDDMITISGTSGDYKVSANKYRDFVKVNTFDNKSSFNFPITGIRLKYLLTTTISLFVIISAFFLWPRSRERFKRGASFSSALYPVFSKLFNFFRKDILIIAGVTYKRKHFRRMLAVGDTGTGKTQFIMEYLYQLSKRPNTRVIVVDPVGELAEEFFSKKRRDTLFNCQKKESPYWDPYLDMDIDSNLAHAQSLGISSTLIEREKNAKEFFITAGRNVLAGIMMYIEEEYRSIKGLRHWFSMTAPEIYELLYNAGDETAALIPPEAKDQSGGVMATIINQTHIFRYLKQENTDGNIWSAKDWVEQDSGWLFLQPGEKIIEQATYKLITLFIDLLSKRLMSTKRRLFPCSDIFLCIDELTALRRISSLRSLLAEARKYKVYSLLGYQDNAQLDSIYGNNDAKTIRGLNRVKMLYRCTDPDSADFCSKQIGTREIEESKDQYTIGASKDWRDSLSVSKNVRESKLVMPSEIMNLDDLEGYVVGVGKSVKKVKIPIFNKRQ